MDVVAVQLAVVIGLTALVAFGVRLLRRSNAERRVVLAGCIGTEVTLVGVPQHTKVSRGSVTGVLLAVDEGEAVVEAHGHPQSIPIAAIQEIRQGRRVLGRW
jgi:hypothetical protein